MSAIRNSCVARGAATSGVGITAFTVPAGYVFLCKSVVYFFASAPATYAQFWLNAPGGLAMPFISNSALTVQAPVTWQNWLAMNAGDFISVICSGSTMDYWISGALLPFNPGL